MPPNLHARKIPPTDVEKHAQSGALAPNLGALIGWVGAQSRAQSGALSPAVSASANMRTSRCGKGMEISFS